MENGKQRVKSEAQDEPSVRLCCRTAALRVLCPRGSVRARLYSFAASQVITVVMKEHPHAFSCGCTDLESGPDVHRFSAQGLTRRKPWCQPETGTHLRLRAFQITV